MLLAKFQVINKEVHVLFQTLSMCSLLIQNKVLNFKKSP